MADLKQAPQELLTLLPLLWSADTASDPLRWTADNPAWGQCAVTALLVQDLFGGELRRVVITMPIGEEISHYFNLLEDGGIVDLTKQQFPKAAWPSATAEPRTRQYVLSYPQTMLRYARLCERYALLRLTTVIPGPAMRTAH